jgi:hypothetical protein
VRVVCRDDRSSGIRAHATHSILVTLDLEDIPAAVVRWLNQLRNRHFRYASNGVMALPLQRELLGCGVQRDRRKREV